MQKVVCSVILCCSLLMGSSFHPPLSTAQPNWISFEEAEVLMAQKPLPVLVDLYTDWCGWCKVMDKKTYSKPKVIEYLNQKFYLVKFNAESRKTVQWKGKTYRFNPSYKTHELALELTKGELAYPTTVFIPAGTGATDPQPVSGYLEPKQLELVATFFGEGHFGKTDFDTYARRFKPSWK